ncbi:hypothetical protein KI387_000146, partial [Taxus chinensis]
MMVWEPSVGTKELCGEGILRHTKAIKFDGNNIITADLPFYIGMISSICNQLYQLDAVIRRNTTVMLETSAGKTLNAVLRAKQIAHKLRAKGDKNVKNWVHCIAADWPFKKIIAAQFATPISANRSDFKTAFAILDVHGNEKSNLGVYCVFKTDQLYLAKDNGYKFNVVDTIALERVQETRGVFLYDALFNLPTWDGNYVVLVVAVMPNALEVCKANFKNVKKEILEQAKMSHLANIKQRPKEQYKLKSHLMVKWDCLQLDKVGRRVGSENDELRFTMSSDSYLISAGCYSSSPLYTFSNVIEEFPVTGWKDFQPTINSEACTTSARWFPATIILDVVKEMQYPSSGMIFFLVLCVKVIISSWNNRIIGDMEESSWLKVRRKRGHVLRSIDANIQTSFVWFGKKFRAMYDCYTFLSPLIRTDPNSILRRISWGSTGATFGVQKLNIPREQLEQFLKTGLLKVTAQHIIGPGGYPRFNPSPDWTTVHPSPDWLLSTRLPLRDKTLFHAFHNSIDKDMQKKQCSNDSSSEEAMEYTEGKVPKWMEILIDSKLRGTIEALKEIVKRVDENKRNKEKLKKLMAGKDQEGAYDSMDYELLENNKPTQGPELEKGTMRVQSISQLESELEGLQQKVKQYEEALASARGKFKNLENEFKAYKNRAHALLQKKEAELSAVKDMELVAAQEAALREAQREAALASAERDRAMKTLQDSVRNHETELAARSVALMDAEERIKDMATKLESLRGHLVSEKEAWQTSILNVEEAWLFKLMNSLDFSEVKCQALEFEVNKAATAGLDDDINILKMTSEKLKEEYESFQEMAKNMIEEKDKEITRLLDDNSNLRKSLQAKQQDSRRLQVLIEAHEYSALSEGPLLFLAVWIDHVQNHFSVRQLQTVCAS